MYILLSYLFTIVCIIPVFFILSHFHALISTLYSPIHLIDTFNYFNAHTPPYVPAPDGHPTDFKVSWTSSRSLTLTWRPIDPMLQNGVITNYTVKCNSSVMYPIQVSPDDNKEVSNGEYSVLIEELVPGTSYQCTVYANTSKEAGPDAVVIRRTFEESELM